MQKFNINDLTKEEISSIAKEVKEGSVVVMPSDTIYGIFTSAFKSESVEKIYDLRKRNKDKAFIILIPDILSLKDFNVELNNQQETFLESIWPGAVSVVLEFQDQRLSYLHRGLNSLAFRVPDNQFLINFLEVSGPLVAPSANIEGEKPSETITDAQGYFGEDIDFYIDGGRIKSEPSTVIRLEGDNIKILREGAVKI